MPHLIGEHVMLREYRTEDVPEIRKWVNDESSTRYLSSIFWTPQSMQNTVDFVNRMMDGPGACFVIADKETEAYIGQLDLFRIDWKMHLGEIGMVIGNEDNRGRGLGCEALKLLLKYSFQTLNLERVELEVYMDNHRALHCYKNAGFVLEGVRRHAFFHDGQYSDVGMMSVLAGEWRAANLPDGKEG